MAPETASATAVEQTFWGYLGHFIQSWTNEMNQNGFMKGALSFKLALNLDVSSWKTIFLSDSVILAKAIRSVC